MKEDTGQSPVDEDADKPPVDDGLIEMFKGRETMRVHPTCVASHEFVGWKIA